MNVTPPSSTSRPAVNSRSAACRRRSTNTPCRRRSRISRASTLGGQVIYPTHTVRVPRGALLTQAVEELATETGDDSLVDRFALANSLHVNFYEDVLRSRTVRRHLDQIETLADTLESMLPETNAQ